MTISTTTSRVSYNGNGVTTVFSFPYRFLANGDLTVILVSAAGAETVKTLTTDYTVLGADADAGGSVTMLVAPATGERLVILREVALTQETDYISGDAFPAESHEKALDRLTMIAQGLQEQVNRSVKVTPGSDGDPGDLVASITASVAAASGFADDASDSADAAAASAVAADASADAAAASAALIALPLSTTSGGSGSNYANAAALFNGIKQAASTTATGVVELATDAEAQAGTDAARAVTPDNLGATVLGIGQTWQDLTGSRALNTLYTNSTGRTISMSGYGTNGGAGVIQVTVGGVVVYRFTGPTASVELPWTAIIPPGATYRVDFTGSVTLTKWTELR